MKLPASQIVAVILLSACGHLNPDVPTSFLGDPAPVEAAGSTIVIQPDTKWVNVTGGDIVRFDVAGKSFAWAFNVAAGVTNFDLAKVAPPGVLNRPLQAYVAPDPKYMGGDGDRND
ncbi:MAG TPA: CzcE family metal-binding protein [Noviherbaspirillum sp.]|nr:CzcE family metal-binding protein [Noviherbaspirillum sp.]